MQRSPAVTSNAREDVADVASGGAWERKGALVQMGACGGKVSQVPMFYPQRLAQTSGGERPLALSSLGQGLSSGVLPARRAPTTPPFPTEVCRQPELLPLSTCIP